jgi:hypothetical protein
VGAAEVVQHLLVGRSLLQWVQLCAVQVLQEGVAQQVVVLRTPHDGGDRRQPGGPGSPPPALTHDQLVTVIGQGAHHDGLQEPDLADRVDQLLQLVLVEHGPGLAGVGGDGVERKVGVPGSGRDGEGLPRIARVGGGCRRPRTGDRAEVSPLEQFAETAPQAPPFGTNRHVVSLAPR